MAASDLIPVARLFRFACDEDVTRMAPRPDGHHCASCRKDVVDMGLLTPEEAVAKVRSAPPSTCVSYRVDSSGSLVFRSPLRGTVVVAISAFLAACQTGVTPPSQDSPTTVASTQEPTRELMPQAAPPTPSDVGT
ncbi:MAG TPA: hypothetical protein VLC09_03715, partial [Polyangiaceae bacterium]|nr:hypothetical protein [Polyangiaceae bacterium]